MADTSELRSQVTELYIASFNRAPDYDGLEYWVTQMSNGMSINEIATAFFQSDEVSALYPLTITDSDFLNTIYSNVLGRLPDDAGKAYWLLQMQNGITKDQMIITVINAAKSDTADPQDKIILANKKEVGDNFAITHQLNDIPLAKSSMALVTTTPSSVNLAKDKQDIFVDKSDAAIAVLEGTDQDDLLISTADNIHIYSWAGNDIITSDAKDDIIYAGSGDDTVYSNAGADTIYGREGNDTVYANSGNDIIYGNEDNDSLHGEAGDDIIYGNDGDDYIYGDDDNDFLVGNDGNDFLYGGSGNDNIYANDGDDNIHTGDGTNFADAGEGDDLLYGGSGIDSLYGGAGNDTLYGYASADILDGLVGNDTIYSGSGNDIINGNDGEDTLYGDSGQDRIDGEKGNDIIDGGEDADTLTGGEGSDTFIFAQADSTLLAMDFITDFDYSLDKLSLIAQGTATISSTATDVTSVTTLQDATNLASTADASVNTIVNWFHFEDNTYLVQDLNADATFNNLTDTVVKIQGLIDLNGLNTNTINFLTT